LRETPPDSLIDWPFEDFAFFASPECAPGLGDAFDLFLSSGFAGDPFGLGEVSGFGEVSASGSFTFSFGVDSGL
jgi:hypothetical protein